MNSWFYLILAGFFEVGFTTFMKLSNGFTHIAYTVGFAICAILSFLLLNKAITHISLGTAYAVWTGIGAFGTAVVGILFFKDTATVARIVLLFLLISSVLGLKLIAGE